MADISFVGPSEQLTSDIAAILAGPFSFFPALDSTGTVIGLPVRSFYAEGQHTFPSIVVRLLLDTSAPTAIGNILDEDSDEQVFYDDGTQNYPGRLIEGGNFPATLECRLLARSEVERERMADWLYRALRFEAAMPDGTSVPAELLRAGITITRTTRPNLPDIDVNAPAVDGMPPWPGICAFGCLAELRVYNTAIPATTVVLPPTFTG